MQIFLVSPALITQTPALRARGTYLLHCWLAQPLAQFAIGRLGRFDLAPGHYYYVGSAFGPGGIAARLRRHSTVEKRPHWHIDYLRPHVELREIWAAVADERLECRWCSVLAGLPELSRPIPHFGASDTGCGGHLFYAAEAVAHIADTLRPTNP